MSLLAPHTWRCFPPCAQSSCWIRVSSTYVEMFPSDTTGLRGQASQLHIRGDVSDYAVEHGLPPGLAPHTWRCFLPIYKGLAVVFVSSTYVEMFLMKLPRGSLLICQLHIRGDVSLITSQTRKRKGLAPHTWRCFFQKEQFAYNKEVSSTYVEMFLLMISICQSMRSQLHIRGDVSKIHYQMRALRKLAPHTWRCFQERYKLGTLTGVSSTYVEMFLVIYTS